MLVVPMRYDGATIGVITLSKLGLDGFGPDDLRLLTILADQAATAVGSARLLTRTQDLARELRRLLDMSAELSGSLDPRQVADLMAGHLARAMGVDECAISYWDRPAGRRRVARLLPAAPDRASSSRSSTSPATRRRCASSSARRPSSSTPTIRPPTRPRSSCCAATGNRILAMLPLVAKGQSIGLVELFSRRPITCDDERLGLARTMANEAAMALENARLYEEARKLADRDPLTGFYNHRFLHERLGEEVVRAQRGRRAAERADARPRRLQAGQRHVRPPVRRPGPDLDRRAHPVDAARLGHPGPLRRRRVRDHPARDRRRRGAAAPPSGSSTAFRDHAFVGEQRGPVPIGASIGVATFPADGRTATDLIAAADQALYRVKREGGHDAADAADAAA